jgi:hypothetical protein
VDVVLCSHRHDLAFDQLEILFLRNDAASCMRRISAAVKERRSKPSVAPVT